MVNGGMPPYRWYLQIEQINKPRNRKHLYPQMCLSSSRTTRYISRKITLDNKHDKGIWEGLHTSGRK